MRVRIAYNFSLQSSDKIKRTYLKLSHLILKMLLSSNNRNTAMFNTIAYLLLLPCPVKALVGTFEVRLLQAITIQTNNQFQYNHSKKNVIFDKKKIKDNQSQTGIKA